MEAPFVAGLEPELVGLPLGRSPLTTSSGGSRAGGLQHCGGVTEWRDLFTRLAHVADEGADRLRALVADRRGDAQPMVVVPYLTYGTPHSLWSRGRVLRDPRIAPAADGDRAWHNLLRAYRRFASNEIAGATVLAGLGAVARETRTDEEGYFDIELHPQRPLPAGQWHELSIEASLQSSGPAIGRAKVLVPASSAETLIISDIDDTVLHTEATSLLRMVRNTLLHNAKTRTPFLGVSELYEALRRGAAGHADNPIFYVSNGPWNLFDFMVDFMEVNRLPPGPILLRDYGFDSNKLLTDPTHKRRTIERILRTYPATPVVLIGDSGEHDPEIYRDVALDQPNRIRAVYIRDVSRDPRDAGVAKIASQLYAAGIDMLLVATSAEAAAHAAAKGLITPDSAHQVASAVAAQAK